MCESLSVSFQQNFKLRGFSILRANTFTTTARTYNELYHVYCFFFLHYIQRIVFSFQNVNLTLEFFQV